MYFSVRLLFVLNFFIIGFCYSQNEPNVYPGNSILREPIPFVNLNNGQQLDSIYFYIKDPQFLSKKNYKYYSPSGLNTKSISISRKNSNNKWWLSFESYSYYDSYNRIKRKTYNHYKVINNKPILLAHEMKYDSIRNITCSNFFFWNLDGKFGKDLGQEVNLYNENGLIEKIEYHTWRGHLIPKYEYSQVNYTYFNDGNLKERSISSLINRMKKVVPMVKDIFYYNENGNIKEKLFVQWNKKRREWETASRMVYFTENYLISRIEGYSLIDDSLKLSNHIYYYYEDSMLVKYIKKTLDIKSEKLINEKMEYFEYDDSNLLEAHIRNKWDTIKNDWVPISKKSWTYNDQGNITEFNYFQPHNNLLELSTRKIYFWNQSDTQIPSYKFRNSDLCKIYPNPVNRRLTVNTFNLKSLPVSFHLFKISGEQVLSGTINSENYSINMEKFASEIYILVLQSGADFQTERIFKY